MAKELIYLGVDGGSVRLALADLNDLTPRDVPVKKMTKEAFNKLMEDKSLEVLGYVRSNTNIGNDTYVNVGIIDIDTNRWSSDMKTTRGFKARVYISGSGKLRVFHPDFIGEASANKHMVLRNSLKRIPVEALTRTRWNGDVEELYAEFKGETTHLRDTIAYLRQCLLTHGLYGTLHKGPYETTCHFYPASSEYGESNPFELNLKRLTLTPDSGRISVAFHGVRIHVEDLTCTSWYKFNSTGSEFQVDRLHVQGRTNLNILHGSKLRISKIQRILTDGTSVAEGLGMITGLEYYPSNEGIQDIGRFRFSSCFNGGLTLDSDLIIPDEVELSSCFDEAKINGKVLFGAGAVTRYSFNKVECKGVVFQGTPPGSRIEGVLSSSFKRGRIIGDVDVSSVYQIDDSFTGVIQGNILISQNLRELYGSCFTSSTDKNYTIDPVDGEFRAGLKDSEARLIVKGTKGNFRNLDVAELLWETEAEEVTQYMFDSTKSLMTNEVPSVVTLKSESFNGFKGTLLDLSLFPNLQTIESKAVTYAEELMVVILGDSVKLSPSTFTRCPKLAHIFIGDEVTGVTASAFSNIAPAINIYYNKNKDVERLGRIPRFKLHPGSTPEDAQSIFTEIEEKFEATAVVATFADIQGIASSARADKLVASQAVLLSLGDTGMSDTLAERHPVIPRCSKVADEVPWVKNAKTFKNSKSLKYTQTDRREEVIRTLVGLVTAHYPFSEDVLEYTHDKGESIIESSRYSFIRSPFLYSGDKCYTYVIVDKSTDTVIHAFTMGPTRDEIEEISYYILKNEEGPTCSIMKYAEDVELIAYSVPEFTSEAFKEVRKAVESSWLPFGSFRIGNKWGIYGIDLHTGDYVAYPYMYKDGSGIRRSDMTAYGYWWSSRLRSEGHVISELPDAIQPQLAGGLDQVVAQKVAYGNLPDVTEYDRGKISLAADIESSKVLLGLFTNANTDLTIAEATKVLLDTELYRKDNRVTTTYFFSSKTDVLKGKLLDGTIEIYNIEYVQITLVNVTDSKGKSQWLVGAGESDSLKQLLQNIIASSGKTGDPKRYPEHYTLTEEYEDLDIIDLSIRTLEMYESMGIRNATSELRLGVSTVSYKACLYFQDMLLPKRASKTVMFWFNSLKDAIRASAEIGLTPQSMTIPSGNREMMLIMPSASGKIYTNFLSSTIEAIREGRPNGYILPYTKCNQVLFDLASKQPKSK